MSALIVVAYVLALITMFACCLRLGAEVAERFSGLDGWSWRKHEKR